MLPRVTYCCSGSLAVPCRSPLTADLLLSHALQCSWGPSLALQICPTGFEKHEQIPKKQRPSFMQMALSPPNLPPSST